MKLITNTLSIALILTFAGCAKDSEKGIDSNGNCSVETVSAYNDISFKSTMYDLNLDHDYLTGVTTACEKFKSLVGNSSCKAENTTTGLTMNVSYGTVSSTCNKAVEKLNQPPVPPIEKSKPAMPPEISDLTELGPSTPVLYLKIKDASVIRQVIHSANKQVIQDGRAIEASNVASDLPYCRLTSKSDTFEVVQGSSMKMILPYTIDNEFLVFSADLNFTLNCYKPRFIFSWKIKDLKSTLSDAADISATN